MAREDELIDSSVERVHATGGGAYKYQDVFEKEIGSGSPLGIKLVKHDEMETLVNGMAFVLNYAKDSSFNWIKGEKQYLKEELTHFPKMLVSIGSGVSIIKVSDFSTFERVSGTMIGGGTLLGLSNLLTGIKDFDQILDLSKQGDNGQVDMLVKDIYGNSAPILGLTGDLLASSFAKVAFDN
jgi:pantothenate kinase